MEFIIGIGIAGLFVFISYAVKRLCKNHIKKAQNENRKDNTHE